MTSLRWPIIVLAWTWSASLVASCGASATPGGAPTDGGADGAASDEAAVPPGPDAQPGADAADGAPSASDGGSGGSPDAGPATPCGTRSGQRGLTSRSSTAAGLKRTYLVYLPPSLDPSKPVPFVFVHHGLTMSGQAMYEITQYTALADSKGIGVAFPDGQSGPGSIDAPWNVGANTCPGSLGATVSAPGDDFAFLDSMEADVAEDQCIDAAHVFVTGFSMGGFFAHQVACMRPDIRAVAPHSGGTHDLATCVTGHKPIIIFHGDSDPVIPDGCDVPGATNTPAGFTPSATAWAARNGCAATLTTTAVTGGQCDYYDGCPADGQVAVCVMHGMGHCWAGGAADGGIFSCPAFASATQLQWAFYEKYAW
ncbi:MAG TPA: PHB depolymerase family esterase [Polyangiaceae bacterium]|nr:PHB depolymerase family esterase [Polyangiaceae bacterium]